MGRVTEKMLACARHISAELDLELPRTTNADGEIVDDESFDAISEFIAENKDDYYYWKRG